MQLGQLAETLAPFVVLLAVGAWLGLALQRAFFRVRARLFRRRSRARPTRDAALDWRGYRYKESERAPARPPGEVRLHDAAEQLRIVMSADFSARPVLNQSEARVFEELCEIVARCKPGWRVMAQVSLGEILRSPDTQAFGCVNSKRVDMLLVDENCRPRHAIEYHGGGHYQGSAAARDAVKKEALRKADIGYHEVVAGKTTPGELRHLIENLVSKTASAAASNPISATSSSLSVRPAS